MTKRKKMSYDQAMEELQGLSQELQEGKVSIDNLSAKVDRAKELITFCREKLRSTEADLGGIFDL